MLLYHVNNIVSIPQAVSTVATIIGILNYGLKKDVSIPQAVSTVATIKRIAKSKKLSGFNTASGKYCCNSGVWKASI